MIITLKKEMKLLFVYVHVFLDDWDHEVFEHKHDLLSFPIMRNHTEWDLETMVAIQ